MTQLVELYGAEDEDALPSELNFDLLEVLETPKDKRAAFLKEKLADCPKGACVRVRPRACVRLGRSGVVFFGRPLPFFPLPLRRDRSCPHPLADRTITLTINPPPPPPPSPQPQYRHGRRGGGAAEEGGRAECGDLGCWRGVTPTPPHPSRSHHHSVLCL